MTKEITQEERLDLTDEKIRAEKLAFSIELFKSLEAITRGKKVVRDNILMADCDLMAENERLKIKNNKMKRLLKDLDYWLGQELNLNYFKGEIMSFVLTKDYIMEEKKKKIEEVLKKVEE